LSSLPGSSSEVGRRGKVYLVGAGPGDPGLITLRGVECLHQADVVVYDRLANPILLRHAPRAEWLDVGKQPDHHPVPQSEINRLLVDLACSGRVVVRLKGGDPFIFGRGGEEAQALSEAGVLFEIVPGVTSAIAVPAYAGIPLTQRNLAGSVAILAGHRGPGSPDGLETIDSIIPGADTLVFLMGIQNLPAIIQSLSDRGWSPETPVAVIERGTTSAQKVVTGVLADILERAAELQPPAITVVGEVVRLRDQLAWFENPVERPLLGLTIVNTRPLESETRDELSDRLRILGAEVLELPSFQIIPARDPSGLDRAILALAERSASKKVATDGPAWDWIVFTSANAVKFFAQRISALGYDLRLLAGARLGAVGEATACALAGFHLKSDFTPARFTGLYWVRQVGDLAGKRVLLPRSDIAGPELVTALQEQGAVVESVAAYSVAPARVLPEALELVSRSKFDVVAFFSPSAVRGLVDMIEKVNGVGQAQQALNRTQTACVGPTTAAQAARLGIRVDILAEEYSIDGLVEALLRWRALW
jgi:uroporphyrinogen III methyltransferase/synthase